MYECAYCSSRNTSFFIRVLGWNICKCETCGVLFTEVKKSADIETNRSVYSEEYIRNYKYRKLELMDRFLNHLRKIEQYKKGGKLLDIGCGIGLFLTVAKKSSRYKWEISGLETNKKLLSQAFSEVKAKIKLGNVEKITFESNYFDCISCFDVLEHSHSLTISLEEIKRVLKKKGVLVIQSPNYNSLMAFLAKKQWPWWLPPDHIYHFSLRFIIKVLEQSGFSILKKFTYEPPRDFLLAIKGIMGKKLISKVFFLLLLPLFLVMERLAWKLDRGALLFVIAQKK